MPRLVVLADSLSFHGPEGPLPLTEERLYPNLLAARLHAATAQVWEPVVVAWAGWGVRELWYALQRDVHLQQQVLIGADAVVLAVGSSDTLSVGVPRPVMAVLPFVRPTELRRRLRRFIDHHHHTMVRMSAGRIRYTPVTVYRHCWRKSAEALRLFAPDAAMCAVLPAAHDGPYYAGLHPHQAELRAVTAELASTMDLATVDLDAIVRPHLGRMNIDGVHWSFEAHVEVADAMAEVLIAALGDRPADAR